MGSPNEKESGITISRRTLVRGGVAGGAILLTAGVFALLRPRESQPSITFTSSTQTSRPEAQKAPGPETVARASAEAVISQDIDRLIDLMAPDKKGLYKRDQQLREIFVRPMLKYHCQGAKLIGEPTVRDDQATRNKLVTFNLDRKCQVQYAGILIDTQNIAILLEFANNQYYLKEVWP